MPDDRHYTDVQSADSTNPDKGVDVIEVFNGGVNDLPGGCLMRITGQLDSGEFAVDVPGADNAVGLVVNFPHVLAAGAYGQAHQTFPASVLFEAGDGTPAVGDEWGVKSGDVKLHKGQTGYTFQAVSAEYGVVVPTVGGAAGVMAPCRGSVIRYVSNSCPILDTINFGGSVGNLTVQVGTTVEYTTKDTCTGTVMGVECFDNPTGCCGDDSGSGEFACGDTVEACSANIVKCLCLTVSGVTTTAGGFDISCLNGHWPLHWDATYGGWTYTGLCDGLGLEPFNIIFYCLDGAWNLQLNWKKGSCDAYQAGGFPNSQTTGPNTWTFTSKPGTGCTAFGIEDTLTIPSMVLVEDATGTCGGSGSGSGGDSGVDCSGGIASVALGTASNQGLSALTLASVTVQGGTLLVVHTGFRNTGASPGTTSMTFNGLTMVAAKSPATGLLADTSFLVGQAWYIAVPTTTTGNIILSVISGTPTDLALSAVQVNCLTHNQVDVAASAISNAGSTTPDAGTITTTTPAEYVAAVVLTNGPSTDSAGSWGGGFTDGGQNVGTTRILLSEGYLITSATGSVDASKSGITSRPWVALEVGFK